MKRLIIANAGYWLDFLSAISEDNLISEIDIRGIARALETVMRVPEAWSLTLMLAQALHPHMEQQGYWADWDSSLRTLVVEARAQADSIAEARLLAMRGAIQRQRGDYCAAMASYRRTWWLCRRTVDRKGRAVALSDLGDVCRLQGHFRRAEVLCQGALASFEALGDARELARAENHLGLIYFDQNRWSEALPHLVRSKMLWEQVGDQYGLGKTLHNLGELHRRTGQLETALDYLKQAIHYYRSVGDEVHVARARLNVGNVFLNQSNLLQAEAAYTQAEISLKQAGDSLDLARARHNLGMVYTRLGNWSEAQACYERALEQWRGRQDTWNLANTLGELGVLHHARGCWDEAQACLDEAWELVCDRPEAHYGPLRRELAERRQEMRRLQVGSEWDPEPTSSA